MPFIHPGIFWTGLAAVSVPIIIHILSRRRFRTVHWAAMRFLIESLRRNRRRLRIEELILLALRCCIILALAAVVARFTGCGAMGGAIGGDGTATNVFVLDDSLSMGQKFGSGEVFSVATDEVTRRIESMAESDRCAIILATRSAEEAPFFSPARVSEIDVEDLSRRIASLSPTGRRADLDEALDAAEDIFAGVVGTKRLYLVGDFRKTDLSDPQTMRAMRKRFSQFKSQDVDVIALDYARPARNNLTVERIELLDRFALSGRPLRIGVKVRNNSPRKVEDVEVRLTANWGLDSPDESESHDTAARSSVEISTPIEVIDALAPQQSKRVQWQLVFPSATGKDGRPRGASALIRAHLPGDELSGDNTSHLSLEVRQAVNVLLVDGRLNTGWEPEQNESFYLARALVPGSNSNYGNSVEVISPDDFGDADLDDYDVVMLLNVASLSDGAGDGRRLEALEQYVRAGGGLAIFMGQNVKESFYNGPLYAEGGGLLPFRFEKIVRAKAGDSEVKYYRLEPKSIEADSLMNVFTGQGTIGLKFIRFFAFCSAEESPGGSSGGGIRPPRVLARFNDKSHSPAVVSRKYGDGRVVAFYTSAHKRWTDWPVDPFGTYVVAVNRMVERIARPQRGWQNAPVAAPVEFELPEDMRDAEVWLETPSGGAQSSVKMHPQIRGEKSVLVYEHTRDSGVYRLWMRNPAGSTRRVVFTRNMEPSEGDLTPGGREALEAAFGSEEFHYRRRPGSAEEVELSADREYWTWMLAALLVFMIAETILGRKFGHYS